MVYPDSYYYSMKLKIRSVVYLSFLLVLAFVSCDKTDSDELNAKTSVSGVITYNGEYTGLNTTIYVRAYTSNSRAIGEPDYITSISACGNYKINLDEYVGDLYISAFMDADNSGNIGGPTALDTLNNGVYSDPMACYGDYSFTNGGPLKITIDKEITDVDFELFDSGVIAVNVSETGHYIFGVIRSNMLSDEFLHHIHCDVTNINDTFYLAVPESSTWYCKLKSDALTIPVLYPGIVSVSANSITEIQL